MNSLSGPVTIILQGGAVRGAFSAGVLYECAERGFWADTVAAASASTPSAMYYTARQHEEMRKIWLEEVGSKRFIRYDHLLTGKPIYDIHYLIDDIFKKKHPLDTRRVVESSTRLIVPLYNYHTRLLEMRTNKDPNFVDDLWQFLHLAMVIHDSHILWGTRFEPYVDGSLDPFVLYKLPFVPENSHVIAVWNEHDFGMHRIKRLGQKFFLALQARKFPAEVQRMLRIRHQLIDDGMKTYEAFCERHRPTIVKPDAFSSLDGLDVLSRSNTHLTRLFEHGREKARQIIFASS